MVDKISPDMMMKQIEQMQLNMDDLQSTKEGAGAPDFKDVLGKLITDVDQAQKDAEVSLKKLATGETTSVQEVVMKMEEADISFKLMKEIRDKLLQAYKDIISMQA